MPGLEQLRDLFDRTQVGLVLVGMPGLEKRLARYAQFYSRIGFVHEFRPLSGSQVRQRLDQRWTPPGVTLPAVEPLEDETIAAIVRVTGGNFRLLHRLLTQMERILAINQLNRMTSEGLEAARESLVIGQALACHQICQIIQKNFGQIIPKLIAWLTRYGRLSDSGYAK